jgi:hypothetical protein
LYIAIQSAHPPKNKITKIHAATFLIVSLVIRKEVDSKNQVGPVHSSSKLSINNMRVNRKLLTLFPIIHVSKSIVF